MPLSPEDQTQIRAIVRTELERGSDRGLLRKGLWALAIFFGVIFSILGLHVLIIGAFTVYHLTHQ